VIGALGDLLVKLALGVLNTWLARRDIQHAAVAEHDLAAARVHAALEADVVAFLLRAGRDPRLAARLRVQPGGAAITGVTLDADPALGAPGGVVPRGGGADAVRRDAPG
jgi:hypothetical protein